ncbi:MAG: DUF4271 domain-containing protein [Candidatus Aphodosoma sp.]
MYLAIRLFSGTVLPVIPRVESLSTTSWVAVTVIMILLVLMTVFAVNRHQYMSQLRNLANNRERVMIYDVEQKSLLAGVLLWVVVIMSYALLMFSFLVFVSGLSDISLPHYFLLVVGSALFFGVKWLLFKALGAVFGIRDRESNYTQSYFIIIALSGIFSLVIATAFIYTSGSMANILWWVYFVFVILFFIFVFFKAIQVFYCGIGSLFYIFLYLCALEIMPAVLVWKAVVMV